MAVLDAIRKAILRTDGSVVQEVFASTDQICIEMADLANDVAIDIVRAHDWQRLTKMHTFPGGAESFPMPPDYDRMVFSATMDDPGTWLWGYYPFNTVSEWQRFKTGGYPISDPGGWIIMGDEFHFFPLPNGQATFPYISNLYARDEGGNPKANFDRDTDTFVLDERLLTLGCIWRWFEQKHMPVDTSEYDTALAQAQGRDRGAYVLRSPRGRPTGARIGYVNTGYYGRR